VSFRDRRPHNGSHGRTENREATLFLADAPIFSGRPVRFFLPHRSRHGGAHLPGVDRRVVDNAHILTPATTAALNDKLAALEQGTSRQLVVVTLPSLQGYDISDYGYQLGRAWGIGQAKLNNGVLFIIAPTEHKTRIEVGYGLEPILTDALSEIILQNAVLPRFRAGDFNGGVTAGVDALIQQLSLERSAAEAKAAAAAQAAQNDRGRGATPLTASSFSSSSPSPSFAFLAPGASCPSCSWAAGAAGAAAMAAAVTAAVAVAGAAAEAAASAAAAPRKLVMPKDFLC